MGQSRGNLWKGISLYLKLLPSLSNIVVSIRTEQDHQRKLLEKMMDDLSSHVAALKADRDALAAVVRKAATDLISVNQQITDVKNRLMAAGVDPAVLTEFESIDTQAR